MLGWVVAGSIHHLRKRGQVPTATAVAELAETFLTKAGYEALADQTKIELSAEKVESLAEHVFQKPISEVTLEEARDQDDPRQAGPVNEALRDIVRARDERAIGLIDSYRGTGKKVFVIAGRSHALTWQPALEAMYQSQGEKQKS